MDIVATANEAVLLLTPMLAYLMGKTQDVVVKEGIKKLGKKLWEKLWPELRKNPAADKTVEGVMAHPDDEDYRAAFRLMLRELLEADQSLADEVARLIDEGRQAGVNVTASGDRSVAAGGNISNNIIVTGDGNKVKGS